MWRPGARHAQIGGDESYDSSVPTARNPLHAQIECVGNFCIVYPSLWPSDGCKESLDVSNNFSFGIIDGILSDFSKVFKFKSVHLGGDEVNTSCCTAIPHIKKWYKQGN
ncbi:beta-hexosaminidase 3-like [Oryza glaberrima]|uniref:beta-hexosaminidase 3-like n=1 Tax=Oryza glaberrima TaxID=4538 RepID=UPI00224C020E|nr:beta-hexosaminidase 3-like [Oryza glaberrima]